MFDSYFLILPMSLFPRKKGKNFFCFFSDVSVSLRYNPPQTEKFQSYRPFNIISVTCFIVSSGDVTV